MHLQAGQKIGRENKKKSGILNDMKKFISFCVFLILAAGAFWFFYALRSFVVMGIYSAQHKKESVMKKNGFEIEMPTGKGWYPFVMTYNADGFSSWAGVDADMSIMYNFGAFDPMARTSGLYDKDSDKYSSFYGAYVVKSEQPFGFSDSGIDMEEFTLAVEYDYTQLVIKDFGCIEPVFSISDFRITDNIEYAGIKGWTRVDAIMLANGAAHNFTEHKTPYLQYGPPMQKVNEDFEEIELFGRVYAKYFDEYDCTLMLYIIAPNKQAAEDCDKNVLKLTKINES